VPPPPLVVNQSGSRAEAKPASSLLLMSLRTFALVVSTWHGWADSPGQFGVILGITGAFAAFAYLLRGVSRSGAIAGAVVCFALFAGAGPGGFAALLSLFVVTWLATRFGLASKQVRGTAERGDGRSASQVFANIGVAAICALLYAVYRHPQFLLALSAALAEPAADTVSSECGQAFSEKAILITTFEEVQGGTNGGITLAGTLSGLIAAVLISLVGVRFELLAARQWWIPTVAGLVGMIADSYLGALVERRGWLGNDSVNFLGTLVAAFVAVSLGRL
jgi:uncharacterized protein (TIGR00297 family)